MPPLHVIVKVAQMLSTNPWTKSRSPFLTTINLAPDCSDHFLTDTSKTLSEPVKFRPSTTFEEEKF